MEISGILNSQLQNILAETGHTQASLDTFEAALIRAQERYDAGEREQVKEACEAFESYFIQLMLKEMRKTSFSEGGMFQKSFAEKMFTDMLDEEMAKSMAKAGGIGLAEQMLRQMSGYGGDMIEDNN